jgi:hypothetical protein
VTDVPKWRGYEPPASDFERARTLLATPFQQWNLDLTNAGDQVLDGVSGDFLYVDTDPVSSNGVATLQLNVQQDAPVAPFYIQPGFAIAAVFKRIRVTWSAQPGKKLRLLFSTGERVVPANSAQVNIVNTVPVQDQGYTYGVAFRSTTAMGVANTPENIWTAGANLAGAVVWDAEIAFENAVVHTFETLLAKATAPATVIDGDVILQVALPVANQPVNSQKLQRPVRIAAGKRLDRIANVAEAFALAHVNYTLL